jgi:hypothetical protein
MAGALSRRFCGHCHRVLCRKHSSTEKLQVWNSQAGSFSTEWVCGRYDLEQVWTPAVVALGSSDSSPLSIVCDLPVCVAPH